MVDLTPQQDTATSATAINKLRRYLYHVLHDDEFNDRATRYFNFFLIFLITLNVLAVLAETVNDVYASYQAYFYSFEIFSLGFFTIEFICRLWSVAESDPAQPAWTLRRRWLMSADALIDIVAILPAYINFFVPMNLDIFRVLRLLRFFKLTRHYNALQIIIRVIVREKSSLQAVVFILSMLIVLAAAGMYAMENQVQPEHFGSIPAAMWWSVVTLTTVGYGDVTPVTVGGRIFAGLTTILGVGLAALPAGILATGLATEMRLQSHQMEDEFRELLQRESLDIFSDPDRIEKLRKQSGLGKESAHDILMEMMRAQYFCKASEVTPLQYCPHCGERLPEPVQTPNVPSATQNT